MKGTINMFILLFLFASLMQCKNNLCESTNCKNAAICNDGICECTATYYGDNCEYSKLRLFLDDQNNPTTYLGVYSCNTGSELVLRQNISLENSILISSINNEPCAIIIQVPYINQQAATLVSIDLQQFNNDQQVNGSMYIGGFNNAILEVNLMFKNLTSGSLSSCNFNGTKQ